MGKSGGAGDITVHLTLSKAKQALLAKHPGNKLVAHIKLSFTPKKGSKLSTSVTVPVG
jgi:hypothetical protein